MDRGKALWTEEGQAGVATTSMEERCAAMLRTVRLMSITLGLGVSQMAVIQEVRRVLHDLDNSWHHGQYE